MPLTRKDGSPPQQTIAGGVPMYVYKGMSFHQLEGHVKDLERRLAEANALLDQVYQYTKTINLGKLGESRVQALIDDHRRLATHYILETEGDGKTIRTDREKSYPVLTDRTKR